MKQDMISYLVLSNLATHVSDSDSLEHTILAVEYFYEPADKTQFTILMKYIVIPCSDYRLPSPH